MAIKHEALVGRSDSYRVNPAMIKIEDGWNPRKEFGTPEDEELKNSIIENGVLVPIRIKKNDEGGFSLIDGERRLRATLKAIEEGNLIESIPALVERAKMNQVEAMFMALLTNTGKKLNPVEEAEAFTRLKNWGVKVEDIAKRMGVSVPHVYNRIQLADLSPKAKEALNNKEIGVVQALDIVKNSNGAIDVQDDLLASAVEEKKKPRAKRGSKKDNGEPSPSQKTPNSNVMPQKDIEDILADHIDDYNFSDDEDYKTFLEGAIRGFCVVLGKEDPFEMKY